MQNMNFTPYIQNVENPHNIAYLRDEDGNDWYEQQEKFLPDTLKVAFDSLGIIKSLSYNVSAMFPSGLSVVEVNANDVPDGVAIDGMWQYVDGEVIRVPVNYVLLSDKEKKDRLATAAAAIAPLQDALDLDIATQREVELLTEWKKYRVLLNRMDISAAPDIEWPMEPV